MFILFLPYRRAIRTKHIHTQSGTLASRKTDIKTPAKKTAQAQSLFCPRFQGSRNLVGIAIQLSDSEQEKLLVGYSMLISPEKFDFGIE